VTSGYSGTPLGRKLGYRARMRVLIGDMPDAVRHEVERSLGEKPDWLRIPEANLEAAHVFASSRELLTDRLNALMPLLDRAGFIWVSWPKKASKVATDITEDVIREVALPMHLVDVKVCSVDDIWSGLKLVIRKEHR
jgi:hypothetical protein